MTDREALKMALEAMGSVGSDLICQSSHHRAKDQHCDEVRCPIEQRWHEAYEALRQALEQPRQECETCANKRRRLAQAGFLKSPLRGEEKQFFYGQDPNVLPASNKGESHE